MLGVEVFVGSKARGGGGTVVVVVAHHAVQGPGVSSLPYVFVRLGYVPVELIPYLVVGKVAQVEHHHRAFGAVPFVHRLHIGQHVLLEKGLLAALAVVANMDVGGKNDSVPVLSLRDKGKVVDFRHSGAGFQCTVEIGLQPVLEGQGVAGWRAYEHEALALVALQGISPLRVCAHNVHTVRYAYPGYRFALAKNRTGEVLRLQGKNGQQSRKKA